MDLQALDKTHPGRLGPLLALDGRTIQWTAADLADLLRHQLSTPLLPELKRCVRTGSESAHRLVEALGGEGTSFGTVLSHPNPPVELLRLIKDFGKAADKDPERPLPPQVATVLYYGAIVSALVRHKAKISGLDQGELLEGVEWALGQPWVQPPMRTLFEEARAALGADRPPSS